MNFLSTQSKKFAEMRQEKQYPSEAELDRQYAAVEAAAMRRVDKLAKDI